MKRIITVIIFCCSLLALSGCSSKYLRISFSSDTLADESTNHIDKDTAVINTSNETFPKQFPVYKITERKISENEYKQMLKQLGIEEYERFIPLEGNEINAIFKPIGNSIEAFSMSDEELEALAWETFNKLPFIEGTYKYVGITVRDTLSDSTGSRLTRVGVSFRRVLDGIPVLGNDKCDLYFDNTGLAELFIKLYDYDKVDNMDLVPLDSASSLIKNPDDFYIDTDDSEQKLEIADTLKVEQIELEFYNQFYRGCTILQPVYKFTGTAADANGVQAEFRSRVIAIPEAYTYESESESKDN